MAGNPDTDRSSQPAFDMHDETVNLGDLLSIIFENRWLIAAILLASLLVGAYKSFTAVPIYRADVLLQVEDRKSTLADLEVASMLEEYTPVQAEIEILKSRSVLGDVVDNLKLDIISKPIYMPYIGEALARRMPAEQQPKIRIDTLDVPESMRGKLLRLVIEDAGRYGLYDAGDESLLLRGIVGEVAEVDLPDGNRIRIFVSVLQGAEGQAFDVRRGSRLGAVRSLKGRLSVEERGGWSGILSITVESTDPASVQDQVNEIADVYVRQNVERKSAEAAQTLEFLDKQLPLVRQDIEAAELALNTYRLEKGSVDLPFETQTVLNAIVSAEAQINELRQEREKVTLAFTELHPTVVALDRQINRLNEELQELNTQVRDLPSTQQELLGLIRNVEVNTSLYTSLLNTAQELRVAKAGTIGNVRIIDYAVRPTSSIKPSKSRIMMLALLSGGFLGIAAAFARKALHAGIEDPDQIERRVNIPVFATIPHSERQDEIYHALESQDAKRAILAVDTPDDPAIESIRNLQTALHFGTMDAKNNCILIAGPGPNLGKSFVSVNLAAVLASNDTKVLLIDADLRRGHLHEYLGHGRGGGLSECISGELALDEVLRETTVPGLSFIPTGALPPNPAELLLHRRFKDCIETLVPQYDHIIIDSPPILAVTDASIIGQLAGATLMLLRAGVHQMREIELAVKRLQQANVNLRGILFNDIQTQSRYYGTGRYYYQYAYESGKEKKI